MYKVENMKELNKLFVARINEKEILQFANNWASLPVNSRLAVQFLSVTEPDENGNHCWQGNFTSLTEKLSTEKIDRSNFRKEMLALADKGILKIERNNRTNMKFILFSDWMNRILNFSA